MKRYYMTEGGALCERTDDHGRALIPHTIIARADACDRLNALEAENAELRERNAGRTALAGGKE